MMASFENFNKNIKDNLQRLSEGITTYEQQRLMFSAVKIELSLAPDEKYKGSFVIKAAEGIVSNALIISTEPRMQVNRELVIQGETQIDYIFDAADLDGGDVVKGEITVLSDCGEYIVPFVVSVVHSMITSSQGQVRNVFHLMNLAQADYQEALDIFYSKELQKNIETVDRQYFDLFRGYAGNQGMRDNLDGFLVAIKKKLPTAFTLVGEGFDENNNCIFECCEDAAIELRLIRNGFGSSDIFIDIDSDFISVPREHLTYEDFLGNTCIFRLYINYSRLHLGNNFCRITLRAEHDRERVLASCSYIVKNKAIDRDGRRAHRNRAAYVAQLFKLYMEFRIQNISRQEWLTKSALVVERLLKINLDDTMAKLFRVHQLIAAERVKDASAALFDVKNRIDESDPVALGYFHYLTVFTLSDHQLIQRCMETVHRLYLDNRNCDALLWMYMYLDEELIDNPSAKLIMLKHQCSENGRGVLMYLEAYSIYEKNPALLTDLSAFHIRLLSFIVRSGLLTAELAKQIVYLAGREKEYNRVLDRILIAIYEEYREDDYLAALCINMMKGGRKDDTAFEYYSIAVEKELRITKLYETYMYSVPDDFAKALPHIVRLYFRYSIDLSQDRMELLFENLITYSSDGENLLSDYADKIKTFGIGMMSQGAINKRLAVIYKYLLQDEEFAAMFADMAGELVFIHRIGIADSSASRLVLVENAFENEKSAVFKNNEAYIPIYGREYEVFLEYPDGRRVSITGKCLDEAVFNRYCEENNITGQKAPADYFAVYMAEKGRHFASVDKDNCVYVQTIIASDLVREGYKKDYRQALFKYYYDIDDMVSLDEAIVNTDLKAITPKERAQVIEFMVQRDMWKTAYDAMVRYGGQKLSPKTAVKLGNRLLDEEQYRDDRYMLSMVYYAFLHGKYDEKGLEFLVEKVSGSTRALRNIWRAATEFDIETRELEERILSQMLYTRAFVGERDEIFESYKKHVALPVVELAWYTNNAFEYVVMDEILDDAFFKGLLNFALEGKTLNNICALALVLYFSREITRPDGQEHISETVLGLIASYIRYFIDRHIVLDEFMVFSDIVDELALYDGQHFIEYKADQISTVLLKYVLEDEDGDEIRYSSEIMKNIQSGIFSKNILLFFGEKLKYYIAEGSGGNNSINKSFRVDRSDIGSTGIASRYSAVNDMLACFEMGDDTSLVKLMDIYRRKKYVSEHIFTLH